MTARDELPIFGSVLPRQEADLNKTFLAAALTAATIIAAPIEPAFAKKASPVATLDTDNDATVDINELNKAVEALFEKLEKDNDGTLDSKELQGRLSKKELKAADPDNDGTLDKNEFLAAAASLFKDADPDNDGTLDDKEFASKKGKAVLRLTR
ncbi:EF-hand domain-containing protein [Methylocystis parvus]|uniref:EF-hand domain-containing protein n=1 Tax=Methylocystis parvus TaxID=134 RepID=A0A6B8M9I1_9HYPH|nr:EF-hand domain-containing protein [Methylocystis parvus]